MRWIVGNMGSISSKKYYFWIFESSKLWYFETWRLWNETKKSRNQETNILWNLFYFHLRKSPYPQQTGSHPCTHHLILPIVIEKTSSTLLRSIIVCFLVEMEQLLEKDKESRSPHLGTLQLFGSSNVHRPETRFPTKFWYIVTQFNNAFVWVYVIKNATLNSVPACRLTKFEIRGSSSRNEHSRNHEYWRFHK